MRARARVRNAAGLLANLRARGPRAERRVGDAMERGMNDTVTLARDLAPKRTGLLASSITGDLSERRLAFTVYCDPAVFERAGVDDYSGFVEHGTRNAEAQPFLHPAHEEMAPHITADVRAALRRGVRP